MIYAVNKRTKEHRIVNDARDSNILHEVVIQADADGWIECDGEHRPIDANQEIQWKGSNGFVSGVIPANCVFWGENGAYKIIAYRPILNAEETEIKQDSTESHLVAGQEYEYSFTMFQHPVGVGMRDLVKFIGMDGSLAVVRTSRGTLVHTSAGCLRAVRSDRDRWIEAALRECTDHISQRQLGKIYDAGLAKLLEQTK